MSVVVDHHGSVTVVTIDRPEAGNSLNLEVISGIGSALDAAAADDAVAAVVLTGAGDRVFCAGLDLRAFADDAVQMSAGEMGGFSRLFRTRYPKPLLAAANGHAVAGGFELLLRCDLVVAAEHAEFGLPEVKRGLVAGAGITMLPRRIAMPLAMELGIVGTRITAARAYELGLVNRVVPAGEALPGALELAARIADNGPLAVRLTKELAYAAEDAAAPGLWDEIGRVTQVVMRSADAREGARAFVEKRAPRWTGR
jgi:enoyl-CoA hydratase